MTSKIAQQVDAFKVALSKVANYSEARTLCISIRENLRNSHTTNTLATYLTHYRKAVKEIYPATKASKLLTHLKLTGREKGKRASNYNKKLSSQQKQLKKIDAGKLINLAVELVEQPAIKGKTYAGGKRAGQSVEKSYYKLVLGLILLTGRRPAEILKTAKFRANKGRKYEARVSGLIKGDLDHFSKVYEIPVLVDSKLIREGVAELRKLKDFSSLTLKQINSKTSKDLGTYCKIIFGDLLGREVSPHSLRGAYAAICSNKYKSDWIATNAYLAQILGHKEDDIQTANSYQKYYI